MIEHAPKTEGVDSADKQKETLETIGAIEGAIADVLSRSNPENISLRDRLGLKTAKVRLSQGVVQAKKIEALHGYLVSIAHKVKDAKDAVSKVSFVEGESDTAREAKIRKIESDPEKMLKFADDATVTEILREGMGRLNKRMVPPGAVPRFRTKLSALQGHANKEFDARRGLRKNGIDGFSGYVDAEGNIIVGHEDQQIKIEKHARTNDYRINFLPGIPGNKVVYKDAEIEKALKDAWVDGVMPAYFKTHRTFDQKGIAEVEVEKGASETADDTAGPESAPHSVGRTDPLRPEPHVAGGGHAAHEGGHDAHHDTAAAPALDESKVNSLLESGKTREAEALVMEHAITSAFADKGFTFSDKRGYERAKNMVTKGWASSWWKRALVYGVSAALVGVTAGFFGSLAGGLVVGSAAAKFAAILGGGFAGGLGAQWVKNGIMNRAFGSNVGFAGAMPFFGNRFRNKNSITGEETFEIASGVRRTQRDYNKYIGSIAAQREKLSRMESRRGLVPLEGKPGYEYSASMAGRSAELGQRHERGRRLVSSLVGGLMGSAVTYELRTGNLSKAWANKGAYWNAITNWSPTGARAGAPRGGLASAVNPNPSGRAAGALTREPPLTGARTLITDKNCPVYFYEACCNPKTTVYVHQLSPDASSMLTSSGGGSGTRMYEYFSGFPKSVNAVSTPYSGFEDLVSNVRGAKPELLGFGPERGSSPLTRIFRSAIESDPDLRKTFFNIGNRSNGRWLDYAVLNENTWLGGKRQRLIDYMIDRASAYSENATVRDNMLTSLRAMRDSVLNGDAKLSVRWNR